MQQQQQVVFASGLKMDAETADTAGFQQKTEGDCPHIKAEDLEDMESCSIKVNLIRIIE